MKKRKISQQAKDRKIMERDRRRAQTLAYNATTTSGFVPNNETLLAQLEAQYEAGEISSSQYDVAIKFLGKKEIPDERNSDSERDGHA